MKKVINGKLYNTETATEIGYGSSGGLPSNDFRAYEEWLYKTKKGQFFLHGEGGPMTRWATRCGNGSGSGSNIVLMTEAEARDWAEQNMDADEIAEHFEVEEG